MTNNRPNRPTTHLEVLSKEWLTPDMLRLIVGGSNFPAFRDNGLPEAYVKIVFDPDGNPYSSPVDVTRMREEEPREKWPKTRTYTVRWVDHDRQRLALDFVIHGDEGVAAPWAVNCNIGDMVQFMGPGGKWSPDDSSDFHLFVGDESSLPAISASLERLPEDARGAVVVEVSEHVVNVQHPAGVTLDWIVRGGNDYDPEVLAKRVRSLDLKDKGNISVFAHGERDAVKQLRRVFTELEIPRERLSISGYWAYGRVEDVFQAEKHTEIGKI